MTESAQNSQGGKQRDVEANTLLEGASPTNDKSRKEAEAIKTTTREICLTPVVVSETRTAPTRGTCLLPLLVSCFFILPLFAVLYQPPSKTFFVPNDLGLDDDPLNSTFFAAVSQPPDTLELDDGCFQTTEELYRAVDEYLLNNSKGTDVANKYGHPIGTWCVSRIKDFNHLFNTEKYMTTTKRYNPSAASFNEDLSNWDTSAATNMRAMFRGLHSFNSDLSEWNVENVQDMSLMFVKAASFNSDLSKWNVTKLELASYLFYGAKSFSSDLSSWNVKNVQNIRGMFYGASSFSQNLCAWGALWNSGTKDQEQMFHSSFNCPDKMFGGTACPAQGNPNFTATPLGPLCFPCSSP